MSAIRSILLRNPGVRNLIRRSYHDAGGKHATMNELPTPNGSWKSHYDARNSKYTMHLLMGIAFFGLTIGVAKASGLVYLNYSPPARPSDD